jgi:serine/threonine-protein kinase HipA
MQIAKQIYGINTADNALIFFKSGEPAYITKRFDIKEDGSKWGKEDFASLAERTRDSHGSDFKYEDISYEDLALIIEKYVGAYQIEIEKFYKLILFNFLFSNGDAHLKNFSLMETTAGDYILSPAYDLLNTRIHVADTFFALKNGLFKDGSVRNPTGNDFLKFGLTIGIKEKRVDSIYHSFLDYKAEVLEMIARSFMNQKAKTGYTIHFNTRYRVLEKK